ncbi:zinc finger protein 502-like isoform X2 [Cyprinodon tularosa]|uniref:zinc finger protein 502-like isoform X2 n=1 Tax=Cyprinodon tularosa TaxID=77115 RepID=UPI0018E20D2D|nr:zinc finger protein 502-like isoform X2 [Cyprinodon tularosa]
MFGEMTQTSAGWSTALLETQMLVMVKEEAPEEHTPCAVLHDPELHHIKEEQEEVCTTLKGKQLHPKEEIDAMEFPITAAPIKSEDDKQSSVLSQLYEEHIKDELPVENDGREESMTIQDHKDGSISLKTEEENDAELSISETKHLSASVMIKKDMEDDWKTVTVPESETNMSNNPSGSSEFAEQYVQSSCPQKDMKNSEMGSSQSLDNERPLAKKTNVDSQNNVQKRVNFTCEDCGKCFSRKVHLKQHLIIHTGQKPFCCDVCGRDFSLKGNLKKHMRIHTGQKPFCCYLCGLNFSQKGHLNTHIMIHIGQKPFCCDLCGQSFTLKSSLNQHMIVHTGQKPFCCDICGQSFSQKGHLNRHMRIHTGQKPFCCDLCGESFNQKGTLNRHMRIHTGQKPFFCDLCGQRFIQKANLNKHHMRNHTGGEKT